MQADTVAQAMEARVSTSFGAVSVVQVAPPSVVATIAAFEVGSLTFAWPTAVQVVSDGQAMEIKLDNPLGAVSVFHVAPPSVVAKITAAPGVFVSPTPVQSEVDGHESPVNF